MGKKKLLIFVSTTLQKNPIPNHQIKWLSKIIIVNCLGTQKSRYE